MDLVDELLPYMRRVVAADRDLRDLSLLWTMIEASSAIGCPEEAESILPTLSTTRQRFTELQSRLVNQLGQECLAELGDELGSTAQCSIDILVRNLFERTADVGFLATDDVLREYCSAGPDERAAARAGFEQRLAEYRAKYTVYDDIIVLSPQSEVLARLDGASGLTHTSDPVVGQALSANGYVERYGASDLSADAHPALLYGHRVESAQGRLLGVLVLRFRFADELVRIFASVVRGQRQVAVLLLDAQDRVVVSNDPAHVSIGAQMQPPPADQVGLTVFAGREYLALTCRTKGYQGYQGPPWRAMAMVSLSVAFRARHEDTAMQEGVSLDNEELRQVQSEVDGINRNLRRVVWNGRLVADGGNDGRSRAQLKAVLQQVTDAGQKMRERAGRSIRDLYRTSLGRTQQQTIELARLAADIMDRNLYERANDCRWWALSPVVQQVLASDDPSSGRERLSAVLRYINSLYTVYTRLVVFDTAGTVIAVSQDNEEASLVGTRIPEDLLAATLALPDTQRYAVSPFEATSLSDQVPTYLYAAAVRAPHAQGRGVVVGGIAIAFNAQREFRAMLDDVLDGRRGIAAFLDGSGAVMACNDAQIPIGQPLPFKTGLPVIDHGGAHYAVAVVSAGGYREFKCSDGYQNHVRVVVALRLGPVERRRTSLVDRSLRALPSGPRRRVHELALFQVGAARYALPVGAVMEARTPQGQVRLQRAGGHVAGLLEVELSGASTVVPVVCARSLFGVNYPARQHDGVVLVMADPLQPDKPLLGFRVDDVISVLDIDESYIQAASGGLRQHAPWLAATVQMTATGEKEEPVLAQLLDSDELIRLVRPQHVEGAPQLVLQAQEAAYA